MKAQDAHYIPQIYELYNFKQALFSLWVSSFICKGEVTIFSSNIGDLS